MQPAAATSPSKHIRVSKTGAKDRYKKALDDLRSRLAGENWNSIPTAELTKAHNISGGFMSTLVRHGIIDQKGGSRKGRQYRRTEKLNYLSAETCMQLLNKDAKDSEAIRLGKVATVAPQPEVSPEFAPEPLSVEVSQKINGKRLTVTITCEGSERAADFAKLLEQATSLLS